MNITEHAKLRMNQRGIQQSIIEYAEFFIPSLYENQSNKKGNLLFILQNFCSKYMILLQTKKNLCKYLNKL